MVAAPRPVVDLVALDPGNPRSIAFQVDRIDDHLASLPRSGPDNQPTPAQLVAAAIGARLRGITAERVDLPLIGQLERDLMRLSDLVTGSYLALAEPSAEMDKALA